MGGSPFQYFIVFFLFLLCFKAGFGSWNGKVGCIEREREALLHFKQGVVDDYGLLSSWGNGEDKRDCCKWRGVECNNQTGHVISLDLHAPTIGMGDFLSLGGKIGPSLVELQHLKHLNLSRNEFEGVVPTQLGNLSNLQSLDLSYNWNVRCENLDWLSGLPLLTHLDLSGVNLSKAIQWPLAINKMPSLTELYLMESALPWIIPTISISLINSSTSLAVLDLSWNRLTSSIYPWLFNSCSSLVHLDVSSNDLIGSIPDAFGNMTTLAYLDLSRNQLGGVLPTQLGNLSNLQSLDLKHNWGLTCENLDWLSGLPLLTHLDLSDVNLSQAIHWPLAINKMPSLTELYLSYTQLPGIIPTVSISHINSSTSLAALDLSENGFTSSIYPWLFNSSSSLVHLDLSDNDLNGSIPDAFGNMATLAYLDLSSNQLEGEIPKSLTYLCNLQSLLLSKNILTGLGLLEKDFLGCSKNSLEALYLSYNQFRGSFPDLSGFSQLRELYLGFNQLNGSLPESIGQLAQLEVLSIRSNSLQGTVPENHLFGLSKLRSLDLSFNSLTLNISLDQVPQFQAQYIILARCKLGPRFPNWLQTQTGLRELDISTSGISDVIPSWFWNITSGLFWLNISNNHISGTLPNFRFTFLLSGVDMSSNCLDGSIPQAVFDVIWLDLSNNMFSGSISLSCESTGWGFQSHVDLSNNRLSGELPKCWKQWENLTVLNLANNNFSGEIKNWIGLLSGIKTLHLRNNSLTGALPSSLKNCRDLCVIDLGKNKLSGEVPAWIGRSLPDLIVLNLRSNEFNGSIPSNLCQLKSIQMLDLSSNNLSGKIPKCLKNLTAMTKEGGVFIAYEELIPIEGMLPSYVDNTVLQWKGKEWEYKNTLGLIKSIDFSSNKLIGEIPIEVTDLVELVSLNLSKNNLIGPIPAAIGQLKLLDFLDLSQNQLNGEIPNSLSQIAGLSVLDLSNNTLSGKIPLGTQLQSFNASAYEGNPGLCGPPLSKKCPEDEHGKVSFTSPSSEKDDIEDDANDIWFYGSIILGFTIGFWGVCGTLVFNSSWRYAYFQFLSKIKDWLYVTTMVNMNRIRRSLQN